MATFPTSPGLPAVTTATECDPDFFNTFVDNINAIGDALIALVGGVSDGYLDLDAAKGIKWGTVLKIYFSGGNVIIDDGVNITGNLDVAGALTTNTIDTPTLKADSIDDSGALAITFLEDVKIISGKTLEVGTPPSYTVINSVVERTYDGDSRTLDKQVRIVSAMIRDLINIGLFNGTA